MGFGIWDTGATGSMGGANQLQTLVTFYTETHGSPDGIKVDTSKQIPFTFADAHRACSRSAFLLPRWFEAFDGKPACKVVLAFATFETNSPILVGLDLIQALQVKLDVMRGTAYSSVLQRFLPTIRLPSGHLAWDLRPTVADRRGREQHIGVSVAPRSRTPDE